MSIRDKTRELRDAANALEIELHSVMECKRQALGVAEFQLYEMREKEIIAEQSEILRKLRTL